MVDPAEHVLDLSLADLGVEQADRGLAAPGAASALIEVNCVAPGLIETDMMLNAPEEVKQRALGETVVDRLGTPEDVTVAEGGTATTLDGGLGTSVLNNDSDPEGDPLAVTDVNGTPVVGPTVIAGTYGSLTIDAAGNWDYAALNSQAVIQALAAGDTLTDTITVTAFDGTTHDVSVTITGVNDAAVIAGDDQGAVETELPNGEEPGECRADDRTGSVDSIEESTAIEPPPIPFQDVGCNITSV